MTENKSVSRYEDAEEKYMENFRGEIVLFSPIICKETKIVFREKRENTKQTNKCYFLIFAALFKVFSHLPSGWQPPSPPPCPRRKACGWGGGRGLQCSFCFTHAARSLLSVTRPLLLASHTSQPWNSRGQNRPLEWGDPPPQPWDLRAGGGVCPALRGPPLPMAGEGAADWKWGR